MGAWERILFAGGRAWACSKAEDEVLEIAVGTGRNLSYYPPGIRLTGIELSSEMLSIARDRAKELGRDVDLVQGDAQALDFPAERFDTVVCTLSLCTIPDDRAAVAEMRRVLRPGDLLILLEHVRSPARLIRWIQRLIDPLAVRFGGDHIAREPLEHLRAEGFEVEYLQRLKAGIVERVLARKPA